MATKVPVSTRALLQRVNRRLAGDGEVLKIARTAKVAAAVGQFFIVRGNRVAREHVDPEALARELGVLADFERVV